MYAIVEVGGKQYKVEPNTYFKAEKLDKAVGDKLWNDADIAAYEENKNNKYLLNFHVCLLLMVTKLQLLQVMAKKLKLYVKFLNKAKKRKLLFTNTKLKRMFAKSKVIVNHTLNSRLFLLDNLRLR